jgi:hypothetical protein
MHRLGRQRACRRRLQEAEANAGTRNPQEVKPHGRIGSLHEKVVTLHGCFRIRFRGENLEDRLPSGWTRGVTAPGTTGAGKVRQVRPR